MIGEQGGSMADEAGARDREVGRWVEPAVSYIDPARRTCGYCGRPIARRYWEREEEGEGRAYCGPEHASRTTYPGSPNRNRR
jgi:hypothetical protein